MPAGRPSKYTEELNEAIKMHSEDIRKAIEYTCFPPPYDFTGEVRKLKAYHEQGEQ